MKERLSVTVEEDILIMLDEILQIKEFRNKSHLVEVVLKKYIMENQNESK